MQCRAAFRKSSSLFFLSPWWVLVRWPDINFRESAVIGIVGAGYEFDARSRLLLNVGYHNIEETASLDQTVENDQYSTSDVGGLYTFGAKTARTQIDFGAGKQ